MARLHGAEDLGGHDHAVGVGIDAHVPGHEADPGAALAAELLRQLAELLVRERLKRGGVHNLLALLERQRDGVPAGRRAGAPDELSRAVSCVRVTGVAVCA